MTARSCFPGFMRQAASNPAKLATEDGSRLPSSRRSVLYLAVYVAAFALVLGLLYVVCSEAIGTAIFLRRLNQTLTGLMCAFAKAPSIAEVFHCLPRSSARIVAVMWRRRAPRMLNVHLGGFRLQCGSFGLERFGLGFCLALRRLTPLFGLLQPRLNL